MTDIEQKDLIMLLKDDTRKVLLLANEITDNYFSGTVDAHNITKDELIKFVFVN